MSRVMWIGAVSFAGIVGCTGPENEVRVRQFEDMKMRDAPLLECPSDVLYIGDIGNSNNPNDDTIVRFALDEDGAQFSGYLVQPGGLYLDGPMGILVDQNERVLWANQNFGTDTSSEIRVLDLSSDAPPELLVAPTTEQGEPHAPWAARGMILVDNVLYVADVGYELDTGRITLWNSETGEYIDDLDFGDFDDPDNPDRLKAPRGIVMGQDGYIYVSNTNIDPTPVPEGAPPAPPTLGGSILRFDPETREFVDVVYECTIAAATAGECLLNRPEGLVFGPDGRLYVTSFRATPQDVDRILILEIDESGQGSVVDTIDLYEPGEPRVFAQALLFGPEGALYVTITASKPPACEVRKYELIMGEWEWECFVGPGHKLDRPFYFTFGETNPATLAYEPEPCD
jgi:sugar lactone lactonase YvrE